MKRLFSLSLLIVMLSWISPAAAHRPLPLLMLAAQGQVPWQTLSPEERNTLEHHSDRWDQYPPKHQNRLRKGADHYIELSPEEKRRVKKMRREYLRKSPEERKSLRDTYHRQRLKEH